LHDSPPLLQINESVIYQRKSIALEFKEEKEEMEIRRIFALTNLHP